MIVIKKETREKKSERISSSLSRLSFFFHFYSLDCREGHMKKNSLSVCLHQGSKEHYLIIYLLLVIDGQNMVGP